MDYFVIVVIINNATKEKTIIVIVIIIKVGVANQDYLLLHCRVTNAVIIISSLKNFVIIANSFFFKLCLLFSFFLFLYF